MKRIILIAIVSVFSTYSFAQLTNNPYYQAVELSEFSLTEEELEQDVPTDTTWWTGGLFAVNFGQVSFNNWAAGGVNSTSGVALANFYGNMKKGKSTWDNSLDLAYGLLKQENLDLVKSDDKIDLASKYGYQGWNEKWYYSALLNFKTQFVEGLDPDTKARISDFMSPGYLLFSLGLDHKPNDKLSFFLSPISAKFTFVGDQVLADAGAFGVEPATFSVDTAGVATQLTSGANSRQEFGAYARAQFQDEIMKNVSLLTRLELFENYETPTRIDINWEALLGFKVNKYITATLGAQAIYDHDVLILKETDDTNPVLYNGRSVQFKEVFNLGFLYDF